MKIVINPSYGGFRVPDALLENGSIARNDRYSDKISVRTNRALIDYVETHPNTELAIIEVPDEATDFEINEYDGLESIIAVVNGKIRHIYE